MSFFFRCLLVVAVMIGAVDANGQSPTEAQLVRAFNQVLFWSGPAELRSTIGVRDSLSDANDRFTNLLLRFARVRANADRDLPELAAAGVTIRTAPDRQLRIFSWDDGSGGSMRYFNTVFQYVSGGRSIAYSVSNVTAKGIDDPGSWYTDIYQLPDSTRKCYLVVSQQILSTKDMFLAMQVLEIRDGKLQDTVHYFRTADGLHRWISSSFNFFSVVDRPERPLKLVLWDDRTATASFPVIDKKGAVTRKFIRYQWKAGLFTPVAEKAPAKRQGSDKKQP